MTQTRRRVAFIGSGGTIASLGTGPLDFLGYRANQTMLHAEAILERVPGAMLFVPSIGGISHDWAEDTNRRIWQWAYEFWPRVRGVSCSA